MRSVFLHGALGERFGERYELEVGTAAEALRCFSVQLPGFSEALKEWDYQILRGKDELGEEDLLMGLGTSDLHFIPIVRGAKNRSVGKLVLGVALTAISGGFSAGTGLLSAGKFAKTVVTLGRSLILGGVAGLLAPTPTVGDYGDRAVDEKPSFLFTGAVNISAQGVAVPIGYGRYRVGSVVVSAGLTTEKMP